MYEIVYSPIVQEKLAALQVKLIELCGEKVGKKRFIEVIDGFEIRLTFSNTGIPIKTMYDVEADFEHYFIIYSHKNYFLYYIDDDKVYVMEMYDEREDFAAAGIFDMSCIRWQIVYIVICHYLFCENR